MGKVIYLNIKEKNTNGMEEASTFLTPEDYPDIYVDHEVTQEEFDKALNTVITMLMQSSVSNATVDLDERNLLMNQENNPAKQLTIEEIEKIVGARVQIVSKR